MLMFPQELRTSTKKKKVSEAINSPLIIFATDAIKKKKKKKKKKIMAGILIANLDSLWSMKALLVSC